MSDPINPSHYNHLPAEAIDIIEAAIANAPSNEAAYLHGQALKYLLRCWEKNGGEDLGKAKWYLDRLLASLDDVLAESSGLKETPIDKLIVPTKRYREPTQADLANGRIFCECRDNVSEEWKLRILVGIASKERDYRFSCFKEGARNLRRYIQCRIEVAE